ncbi:MAG: helix-turn-helix domain-containing protein [Eubacteriales bacterium]
MGKKKIEFLTNSYGEWKTKGLEKGGYFVIFNGFKTPFLKKISGKALKLYIYFGIHSGNYTGESWHSIETIAGFFGVSIRTVQNWVKELEELGLIERLQKKPNSVAYTYLKTYQYNINYDIKDGE